VTQYAYQISTIEISWSQILTKIAID